MRRPLLACLAIAAALALGCAGSAGGGTALPTWPEWLAQSGPPPAGQGRIVVYGAVRDEALEWHPEVLVDGAPIGRSRELTFLVAERPPGLHVLTIGTEERDAAFGTQGDSGNATVPLRAGQTAYVQLLVEAPPGMVRATLVPMDPPTGNRDVQAMRLAPPSTAP